MIRFVLSRLLGLIGVLLVLLAAVFALQRQVPGDPVRLYVGPRAPAEVVEAKREELGLDKPLVVQYVNYVALVAQGNLQMSLHTRRPVTTDLAEFLPASGELLTFSLLLAILAGGLLGLASAARWRGAGMMRLFLVSGSSMPVFLLGLGGVILFHRWLGWLPASGRTSLTDLPIGPTGFLTIDGLLAGRLDVFVDTLWHLILPGIAIALGPAVSIGRVFRSSLVGTLRADHIRTARAKGLTERRVVWRHAVRNSLGPPLSVGGLQVAVMMGSLVVIEIIFAWPGIGPYTVQSVATLDYPAIAGVTLVLGAIYVLINAAVDILQAVADPRIRTI